MKYKNYVKEIDKTLREYKQKIDELNNSYRNELRANEKRIENMEGVYTEKYIEEYKKNWVPNIEYGTKIKEARTKAEPVAAHYLGLIEKQLNKYFNTPVRAEFANSINSIAITGLPLTNTEFEVLQGMASSYMERRVLNHLGMTRKKEVLEASTNLKTGETTAQSKAVADPFVNVKLPDIDKTYDAFREYRNSVEFVIRSYSGECAELYEYLGNNTPQYVSINAGQYFTKNIAEKFTAVMEEANSILPKGKEERELTENEKKLIDILIDPKYPNLAATTVKEISANNEELAELFSLDSRYSKFVPLDNE